MRRRAAATAAAAAGVGLLVGCTNDTAQPTTDTTLVVFAAASVAQPFERIAAEVLPDMAPGVTVTFNSDGSSTLVQQILAGAPADVIATANDATMRRLIAANSVADVGHFATNYLEIIVPQGNPAAVTGFDESLNTADLVVCAPQVPCGAATAKLAATTGVTLRPLSEENNVTSVRTKIETGQGLAGIVYATDAKLAKNIDSIPIPQADVAVNHYPIARVTDAANPQGADAFIRAVHSDKGQKILAEFGFGTAP